MWILPLIMVGASLAASLSATPNFRLFANSIGKTYASAGFYFPHDEFYDASTRETIEKIIAASPNQQVKIANETPILFEHYINKTDRADLISISLSDKTQTANLAAGDFIIATKGRRYLSNDSFLKYLENSVEPFAEIKINEITSVKIYQLNEKSAEQIRALSKL
jgi:hypothetical protein